MRCPPFSENELKYPQCRLSVSFPNRLESLQSSQQDLRSTWPKTGNNRLICGSEIPQDVLDWISSVQGHSSNVNHCELLAVLVAVMTFPDVLQGRNILLFTDNLTVLRSLVHGYMRTPELGAMSNAIHLALAGLEAQYHALHVPGAANPADIPSRVPFIHQDGEFVLDPAKLLNGKTGKADTETIRKLQASHRPAVFPTSTQLDDITTFDLPSCRSPAARRWWACEAGHP